MRRILRRFLGVGVVSLLAAGCSVVGPHSISQGRATYSEVLSRTGDEQYLAMIVRTRYAEAAGLLTVASITSSLRFSAQLAGESGLGATSSVQGNLVPLSAGLAYEENPTISYVPLDSKKYISRLLSPVPVEPVVLLAGLERDSANVLELTVDRIGTLRNPIYGRDEDRAPFRRAVRLLQELELEGVADFAQSDSDDGSYALLLHDYASDHVDAVREFLRSVGLSGPPSGGGPIVVPILSTVRAGRTRGILLDTRSLVEVLEVAAACIDVPPEHRAARLVDQQLEGIIPPKDFLRIRSSEDRPDDAYVAVPHHGAWFYIPTDDGQSKFGFRIVVALLAMQLNESPGQAGPLLTIPVGGGG